MKNFRLLATALILFSIIFLPYYIYVSALILAMAAFPMYWESILLGLLIDALYGRSWDSLSTLLLSPGFLALAGLIILIPLRQRIRSHGSNI